MKFYTKSSYCRRRCTGKTYENRSVNIILVILTNIFLFLPPVYRARDYYVLGKIVERRTKRKKKIIILTRTVFVLSNAVYVLDDVLEQYHRKLRVYIK